GAGGEGGERLLRSRARLGRGLRAGDEEELDRRRLRWRHGVERPLDLDQFQAELAGLLLLLVLERVGEGDRDPLLAGGALGRHLVRLRLPLLGLDGERLHVPAVYAADDLRVLVADLRAPPAEADGVLPLGREVELLQEPGALGLEDDPVDR